MSDRDLEGRRILIVEDDMMVVMLLEDMLEEVGCEVADSVARTSDALMVIDEVELDAALLDLNLDGDRSFALADALVERGVPFVFSTGYDASSIAPEYRDRPVLKKPFQANELRKVLASLFNSQSSAGQA